MKPIIPCTSHLSDKSRYVTEFLLSQKKTPQNIVDEWDEGFHERVAPSVQAVYKIKRQVDNDEDVAAKKSGPKTRSVLTPQVLDEIDECIEEDEYIRIETLSRQVKLAT